MRLVALPYCWVLMALLGAGTLAAQPAAADSVTAAAFFARPSAVPTPAARQRTELPTPVFDRYELRTRTRDFDVEQQEYTLRLLPASRAKNRALSDLYNHTESAPDFEGDKLRCESVEQRYADWLELWRLTEELTLLDRLAAVYRDRATVLQRMAGALDFDWSELIDLRRRQTDLDVRRLEATNRVALLKQVNGVGGRSLSFSGFIDPAALRARLDGAASPEATDPEIDYEIAAVEKEIAIERAERRQYLDFAQLRYRGPHGDPGRERLSVGVGLQLPNGSDQLLKIRELELEAEALRNEQAYERAERATTVAAARTRLLLGLNEYATTADLYAAERADLAAIANNLRRRGAGSPLRLLDIAERAVRNDLRLLNLRGEVTEDHLRLAVRAGQLCEATGGELLSK